MNLKKLLLGCVVVACCLVVVTGCVVVQHDPHYQPAGRQYTYNSGAYWYYYPQSRVYYHITERYYYYPVNGGWRKARYLPAGWVIDSRDRVRLKIAGMPYSRHAQHLKKYPPRNVAEQKRVPWGQSQEHTQGRNVEREHPRNHAGNSQQPDKPEHASRDHGNMEHVPPGQANFMDGKPGKDHQQHGNSDGAPGHNKDVKGLAKHKPGQAEHGKQGYSEHGKNRNKDGSNQQPKSAENNNHGNGKNRPDKWNQQNANRGKPERSVVQQGRPGNNNKGKRENVRHNVAQEQDAPSARHGQSDKRKGKPANSGKAGKNDNYRSHEREQVNAEQVQEERSNIAADDPQADSAQHASKGSTKKQARVSEDKSKGKHKKSASGGKGKNQVDNASDEETDDQPANTKANNGKGKGR